MAESLIYAAQLWSLRGNRWSSARMAASTLPALPQPQGALADTKLA
ncbi:MAG: hypothetical protein ACRECD_04025 [Burkholderiaceae bacterium]